jgi:Trp operon repressor
MPHITKKQLDKNLREKLNVHLLSILLDTARKDRTRIFKEILTKTERVMIAKRLLLLMLIDKSIPTHKIAEVLSMSPSTVARYELKTENNAFRASIKFLKQNDSKLEKTFSALVALAFSAKTKSFQKFVSDM